MDSYPVMERPRLRKMYAHDRRLQMHPRVKALFRVLDQMADGDVRPLPADYVLIGNRSGKIAYDDCRRLYRFWTDGRLYRFTKGTVRRAF